LIQHEGDKIGTKKVPLSPDTILERGALDMHYGDGAGEWHEGFVRKFCARPNGLTIFEGKPGTGKTFYLRHLMGVLRETHRFYFIPTSSMEVLSRPGFVGFWADQRREYLGSSSTAKPSPGSKNCKNRPVLRVRFSQHRFVVPNSDGIY
jgi:hypothetical protein